MKTRLIALFALSLLISGVAVARDPSATLTVTKIADTADGACDADCSLREAVTAAAGGDVIVFSPLFDSPRTITLTAGQIQIVRKLTIDGPGQGLLTVSGNNASRIFHISGGVDVALEGMKLTNGLAGTLSDQRGGAIYLTDSTLTVTQMTITNNAARYVNPGSGTIGGSGGGIYSASSSLTITDSTISNNMAFTEAVRGGGIAHTGTFNSPAGPLNITGATISNNTGEGIHARGVITINTSTISGNTYRGIRGSGPERFTITNSTVSQNQEGGIIPGDANSVLTVDHCVINNNRSAQGLGGAGGGIKNFGVANIRNTTITNNQVTGRGGGIINTGDMSITNSAVLNNLAGEAGGGIYTTIGQLYLTNSTVSGNVADFNTSSSPGGGIYSTVGVNSTGSVVLTNCTITNNRASALGGGLRNDSMSTATIRNTVIAGNISSASVLDVSGTAVSEGFNLIGSTAGSVGWVGTDLINVNPLLAPLGNNGGGTFTHALMPGSMAINGGSNALSIDPATNQPLSTDQRGFSRYVGGVVDIGAHESNISNLPVNVSGRVTLPDGRGVYMARITLTDPSGAVRYTQSNPFGYYRFLNLPAGVSFTVNVSHKFYQFISPQTITTEQNRDDLNFIASL